MDLVVGHEGLTDLEVGDIANRGVRGVPVAGDGCVLLVSNRVEDRLFRSRAATPVSPNTRYARSYRVTWAAR